MKRGMGWPIAVGLILGLTVAANVWLIRIANTDPSFAIEANYYQRGVHWDDEMAQQVRNARLGWRLLATLSPIERGRGADLRVALNDSAVAPIVDASVKVWAVHVARAGQPVEVTLRSSAPGEYAARVPIERAGLWELRIDVHRGADRFTALERLDVRTAHPEE